MNRYEFSKFSRTDSRHPNGWKETDAIAAERAREEFIIDFVMRDKAEAFEANPLSLNSFFIVVAITHGMSHFSERT
ncbi:hypothetical protein [Oligoflexus tunisiensis]|uniref:hypothetical protein n=1 Tax=Oligoflexus tunisiensis TaxID=708132 RepID=UPI00114D0A1E|nr:hypothetical protein [Oligoflexus tunisiensis]